jgi:hypothetical protein
VPPLLSDCSSLWWMLKQRRENKVIHVVHCWLCSSYSTPKRRVGSVPVAIVMLSGDQNSGKSTPGEPRTGRARACRAAIIHIALLWRDPLSVQKFRIDSERLFQDISAAHDRSGRCCWFILNRTHGKWKFADLEVGWPILDRLPLPIRLAVLANDPEGSLRSHRLRTELLHEDRDVRRTALLDDRLDPPDMEFSRVGTALATDDDPVDLGEVEFPKVLKQRLTREHPVAHRGGA